MRKSDLFVVVQAMPGRPELEITKRNLEESDIGSDYEVMEQGSHTEPRQHFLNVMRRMLDADTEYVLRLEDDCFKINRHIKHNLLTWPLLKDWKFGAGWAFRPQGLRPLTRLWHRGPLHASLGTLFRRDMLPEIIKGCERYFEKDPAPLPQDIAISMAVYHMNKQCALHGPSLIENNCRAPSTLGHINAPHHTAGNHFNLIWRR